MLIAVILQAAMISLPYPYLENCAAAHDHSCEVAKVTALDVAYVNKVVATTITPALTPSVDAPWVAFPPDRKGDCKVHTMTVRASLLALGVPASAMTIEAGEVRYTDGHWENHLDLAVKLDGQTWILDVLSPDAIYSPDKRPYQWRPLSTQSHDTATWTLPAPQVIASTQAEAPK